MIGTAVKLARGVVETVPGGVEEAVNGGVGSPDAFRPSSGVVDAGSVLEECDLDHGFCEVGERLPHGARRVSLHEHSQGAGCDLPSGLSSLDGVTLGHRCRSDVRGSLG
ncbi:hypothetical protein, partial [Streptomyces mediolani]|uniref:hypothetical protein n=1 Tax=Streptomyces mediolani TaxID=68237 RepID=UPI000515A06C